MEKVDAYKKLNRLTKLYLQALGDETKQILNDADNFEKIQKHYNVILKTLDAMYQDKDCKQLGKLTDERISILRTFLEVRSITNIHNALTDIVNAHNDSDKAWGSVALTSLFNLVNVIYQFINTYLTMFQAKELINNEERKNLNQLINEYNQEVEDKIPVLSFDLKKKENK